MARVDEEACTGCGACIDVCPDGAIAPVVQGELVPAPERPAPVVYRSGPLVQGAGTALTVAGVGLLTRAAGALRAASRWLVRQPAVPRSAVGRRSSARTPARAGRRARHRRRGW